MHQACTLRFNPNYFNRKGCKDCAKDAKNLFLEVPESGILALRFNPLFYLDRVHYRRPDRRTRYSINALSNATLVSNST